mgnify:CR=1 FL=1
MSRGLGDVYKRQIHIFVKFWELTCTGHGLPIDDIGRDDFRIAVFLGVLIKHEVIDRTFQTGPQAQIIIETTARNLGCPIGIEDAQDLLDEFEKVFAETEEELYGGKKS